MIAKYSFNSHYRPNTNGNQHLPSLRLLEGGVFQPGEYSPVVVKEYAQLRLKFFRWGLKPAWEQAGEARSSVNLTPAEQLFTEPEFSLPIRTQRCLIPADGYYLDAEGKRYKLSKRDEGAFCFAGIFGTHQQADGTLGYTFSIITTDANEALQPFGLQMPMILSRKAEQLWLDQDTSLSQIAQILKAPVHANLQVHPVEELQDVNPFELYPQPQVAA